VSPVSFPWPNVRVLSGSDEVPGYLPIFLAGRDAEERRVRHVVIDCADSDPRVQNPKAVRAAARSHRAWPTLLKMIVPPGLLDQRRASSS